MEEKEAESLLDGDGLREKLESLLPNTKRKVIFISAYITQSGIDWFCKYTPREADRYIICRLSPSDVISGSTHLTALKTALDMGVQVSCLHSLHAKIYSIDDETIYTGSANLTSNGLKISGVGNLEASLKITASQPNLDFIDNILISSTNLNEEILQNMQSCVDLKERKIFFDKWPEGILKEEGIWVQDFFWSQPRSNIMSDELVHDLNILGIKSFEVADEVLREIMLNTRCMKWLTETLKKAPDQELYFGSLSKVLHDDIKDDPAPYRKDIKSLIQNMLGYCDRYLSEYIEISTPTHSQKVRLLVAG